jgi:hypothetical protein
LNSQNKGHKEQIKGLPLNNDTMTNERLEREAFDLRSKLNRIENSKQVYEMVTEQVLSFFNEINSTITETDVRSKVGSFTLPKMKHGCSERKQFKCSDQNLNQEVLKYKFERQFWEKNTEAMVIQKSSQNRGRSNILAHEPITIYSYTSNDSLRPPLLESKYWHNSEQKVVKGLGSSHSKKCRPS